MKNDSVFSRAYSYRQRENKNNLENYTTEIFNHCFSGDAIFQKKFLKYIGISEKVEHSLTQRSYDEGRPDIQIFTTNWDIIIECKIDSAGSEEQLNRYLEILKGSIKPRTKLIFLTKIYTSDMNLAHNLLRWSEIASLIDEGCNTVTQQFSLFLKENEITMDNNFTASNIVALQNIHETISKMDSVFSKFKDKFEKSIGPLTTYSARSTRMQSDGDGYYSWHTINKVSIYVGFFWWKNEVGHVNDIWAGICLEIYPTGNLQLIDSIKESLLSSWNEGEDKGNILITRYKNVMDVMGNSKQDHIIVLSDFIENAIDELLSIKHLF